MQLWNFVLMGVTGDLAHRKILPALSAFASSNQNEVAINLIGYSRSEAKLDVITKVLDSSSARGRHTLRDIRLEQGDYNDATKLEQILFGSDDRRQVYVYLAVPPTVIIEFLAIADPIIAKHKAQDPRAKIPQIIIEKPFGTDSSEAKQIVEMIMKCNVEGSVHFIDHYLFKSEVRLSEADQYNLKPLMTKPIDTIEIKAAESLGVEDRKGYYLETGAFKDMFVHLYSLLMTTTSLLRIPLTASDITPKKLTKGQYQSFGSDVKDPHAQTDTYFNLQATMHNTAALLEKHQKILLTMESGKKLAQKVTQISINFVDGSTLCWQIAPAYSITIKTEDQDLQLRTPTDSLGAHENMFRDLLNDNYDYFITTAKMMEGWEVFDAISQLKGFEKLDFRYQDGRYPVQEILEK
jgi:glucose-6-phosphate 1-dehydrogenase